MMTNERWNELQSEVFKNTFTMNIDGISLKDTIVNLNDRINIWKNFYKLLGDVLDPIDKRFNVMNVSKVSYKNGKYLFIKISLWYYVVIDLENKKTINEEAAKKIFDVKFFKDYFYETDGLLDYYSFDSLSDDVTSKVIDYYIEHENILTDKKSIRIPILDTDEVFGYLIVYFDKDEVMIGINGKKEGRCNYLFLNNDLKVYGASNLTGNKEEVASYFDGSRDIMIPSGIMEQYVKDGEIKYGNSFSFNK
jgi:hypothetical protein